MVVVGEALEFTKIGVVKVPPAVPTVPIFEAYQTTFPVAQVAVNVAANPEQIVVPAAVGAVGFGFTVTFTWVLGLTQLGVPPVSQAAK